MLSFAIAINYRISTAQRPIHVGILNILPENQKNASDPDGLGHLDFHTGAPSSEPEAATPIRQGW